MQGTRQQQKEKYSPKTRRRRLVWNECEKKRRFRDFFTANKAAKAIRAETEDRVHMRAYECPICRGYHLANDNRENHRS